MTDDIDTTEHETFATMNLELAARIGAPTDNVRRIELVLEVGKKPRMTITRNITPLEVEAGKVKTKIELRSYVLKDDGTDPPS